MHAPQSEVILLNDGAEFARIPLTPGAHTIGRAPGSDIRIEVGPVSRSHARLVVDAAGSVQVEDLASANGTFLDEAPVGSLTPWRLHQTLRIGGVTLRLRALDGEFAGTLSPSEAAEAEPPLAVPAPPREDDLIRQHLPLIVRKSQAYALGAEVARGGMGAVLQARESATRRTVAMKVMLRADDPQSTLRFIEEAQVTAQLEHPNIVPIHDLGIDEHGQPFYTMKLVAGITLKQVLEGLREGAPDLVAKYPLGTLLTDFQKVCDALAFAHSRGVLHRDLKPANLMLGKFGEVLVMDWGLAKIIGPGGGRPSAPEEGEATVTGARREESDVFSTMDGAVMGTPYYMSPEQARGEIDTLDARSDVFALGAILYEIVTLQRPFTGRNAAEIIEKILEGQYVPPAERVQQLGRKATPHLPAGEVPESLAAVIRKALTHERNERYPNVAALQADLTAYQNGFATSAEEKTAWKQFRLFLGRHRAVSAATAAALVVLVAISTAFTFRVLHERNVAQHERDVALTQYNRAETTLTQLRGTAPTFAAQAAALINDGKLDEALTKAGYAVELDPQNADYLLLRAHLYQSTQRLSEAAASYRQALASRPTDNVAQANLTFTERLLATNGSNKILSPESQRSLVDWLISRGRAVEAGPLSRQLGGNARADEAAIKARLVEYTQQKGWNGTNNLRLLPNGTFELILDKLKLGDLSKLRGLPITGLSLGQTGISDLRPISAMRLTYLRIGGAPNRVQDLSPLRGMKLRELGCESNGFSDLDPLREMPLEALWCSSNKVADLTPLRGMPLKKLHLGWNYDVRDLSALADSPLEELTLNALSKISDLRPLKGLPLRKIDLAGCTQVLDVSPLAGCLQLEEIVLPEHATLVQALQALPKLARIKWTEVTDAVLPPEKFWPLVAQKLDDEKRISEALAKAGVAEKVFRYDTLTDGTLRLTVVTPNFTQIPPFDATKVSRLILRGTDISDLTPLRGVNLRVLIIEGTKVTSLELLRGMRLTKLNFGDTAVNDPSPLLDCPTLEQLVLPRGLKNIELLKKLPNLRYIGYSGGGPPDYLPEKTAAQFWAEYDAQHPPGKK